MRPRRILPQLIVLGVLALFVGCSDVTAPRSELLTVFTGRTSLTLSNSGPDPVFYLVSERDFMASALFALCRDPASDCDRVPPRSEVEVPFTEIAGYRPDAAEAVVLHWRLVPAAAGGFEPDSVRALVAPLR